MFNNMSMEQGHISGADKGGIAANFTGTWREWGKVDVGSIQQTGEGFYELLERDRLTFRPMVVPALWNNPVTGGQETSTEDFFILRGDDGTRVGLGKAQLAGSMDVGGHYETLQLLVGELSKLALPARAISFRNGARALIQMLIPEEHIILDRPHKAFYSVLNALDGSSNAKIGFSDYCPICDNTYAALRGEIGGEFQAKHTSGLEQALKTIQKAIFNVGDYIHGFYSTLEDFSTLPANNKLMEEFELFMIPDPKEKEARKRAASSRPANRRAQLGQAISTSLAERNGSTVTFYDLLQGVTRLDSQKDAEYAFFGAGAKMNESAMAWLTDKAK